MRRPLSVKARVSSIIVGCVIACALPGAPAIAQIITQSVVPQPPERITVDRNNVEVTSGAVSISAPELSIGAGPYGLKLTRYFDSRSGWRDSFTGLVEVRRWGEDLNQYSFTASWGNQSWTFGSGASRSGDGASLSEAQDGKYVLITRDGTVITYTQFLPGSPCNGGANGEVCFGFFHATQVVYANGVIVTPHYRVYNGTQWFQSQVRIQSVTTNTGYQIKFTYQSNTISDNIETRSPWLTRVGAVAVNNAVEYCNPDADTCTLTGNWPAMTYSNVNGAHTITDALGNPTVYTYGTSLFRIRTAESTGDNFQYTYTNYGGMGPLDTSTYQRVTSANLGGNTWSYAYTQPGDWSLTTTVTDQLTHTAKFYAGRFTFPDASAGDWSASALLWMKDGLDQKTEFTYPCGAAYFVLNTQAYSAKYPETNEIARGCDASGNVTSVTRKPKTGAGVANIVTSATFPCTSYKTCNKPSATVDGRSAQTDYTYAPEHGGVLTETGPAVNGVRPQKRYKYEYFFPYVKDASGTMGPVADFVYLPVRISECRTSNYVPPPSVVPCEAGAGDETVTNFYYGGIGTVNRMLLRGKRVTSNGASLLTCYSYDNFGNQISVTSPRALLSSCPETVAAGAAFTKFFRYDAMRQLVGTIGAPVPGGYEAVRNKYDKEGRVKTIQRGYLVQWQPATTLPDDWQTFTVLEVTDRTYDSMGRLLTEKRSSGTGADPVLVQYSYDAAGRRECTAIRMNGAAYAPLPPSACSLGSEGPDGPDRITRLVYDAADRVTIEQRALLTNRQQNYATYGYTPNGRQDWVEDANGKHTDFMYDGFDRLKRITFPSTTLGTHDLNNSDYEEYGYDPNDNRTSLRLRSNDTISFHFDALNRLDLKDFPGTSAGDVYYGYDLQGHNLFARFGSTTGYGVTNVFDGFGRLVSAASSSSSGSLQLSYLYDEDGNRKRVTWPDTNYVEYTYDGLDRMDQVRENGIGSAPNLLADYSYDMLSRRSSVVRGNGTSTTYYFDGISRLSDLVQDLASTSGDVTFGFSYNKASQITERRISNDAYAYFALPASRAYVPDGLNRYASVGGVSYAYDLRGNLMSDGSRSFQYDLENHLLSVSGSKSLQLSYDPMGRLQTTSNGTKTTRYLYDGDALVAEYEGGVLQRRYVHGAGVDEPLVWYEGAGLTDRRWLHTNHQGSVISTSDGAGSGTLYAYGPYGEPAYDNWGGSRFRYTGQIMLPDVQLYHYKARVYDPLLGRFLQTDPVGYQEDINLYLYAGNDPLNRTDPSGKCGICMYARPTWTVNRFPIIREAVKAAEAQKPSEAELPNGQRIPIQRDFETAEQFARRVEKSNGGPFKNEMVQPERVIAPQEKSLVEQIADFFGDFANSAGPKSVNGAAKTPGPETEEDESDAQGKAEGNVVLRKMEIQTEELIKRFRPPNSCGNKESCNML